MALPRLLTILMLLASVKAGAQTLAPRVTKEKAEPKGAEKREQAVPKEYMPPRGMCRVWVDNVPAARQPAPTDCPTAIRNRPPNAKVIFGPARTKDGKASPPPRTRPDTTKRKPPA
jgi:hypothetical protein